MRRISFAQTTEQILNQTKTVTRRLGWSKLKAGEFLLAVDKGRGLKKGETAKILGVIEVVSVRTEPLFAVPQSDMAKEGFPMMNRLDFVEMFIDRLGGAQDTEVRRIEFRYRNDILPPV